MKRETYEYLFEYVMLLKPIFDKNIDVDKLIRELYDVLINEYEDVNDSTIYLSKNSGEIIDSFVTSKVKPEYSEEFRYAYINVYNKITDVYSKTNQNNKTMHNTELLTFYVIFNAILNNCELNDFNTFKMDGFIEQFAMMDIIKQNSINKNEEILSLENRRDKVEKTMKFGKDFVNSMVATAVLIGALITSNIIINTVKGIIKYVDNKHNEKAKLSDIKPIESYIKNTDYYDYENNEYVRS